MRDLALGDAHVVAMDDVISRDDGCDLVGCICILADHELIVCVCVQLALVVAQSRDRDGQLSGVKLSALSTGLKRVAKVAKKRAGKTLPVMAVIYGL